MCYVIPVGGAIVSSLMYRKNKEVKMRWLNLMFYGGAIFGVIDHLWNGELFTSPNIIKDLSLGVVISVAILAAWFLIVGLSKVRPELYPELNAGKIKA